MEKIAVVVGNGTSRKSFDIEEMKKDSGFTFFGCNASYRDYPWIDFLVAIDHHIIQEIQASEFPEKRFIVPPLHEQFEPLAYSPHRRRENAGMVAMREAIKRGHNHLICLGFDFLIENQAYNASNIYDGTNGYGPETRASVEDCINRVAYLDWFAQKNPNVTFTFLFPKGNGYTFRKVKATNIKGILV